MEINPEFRKGKNWLDREWEGGEYRPSLEGVAKYPNKASVRQEIIEEIKNVYDGIIRKIKPGSPYGRNGKAVSGWAMRHFYKATMLLEYWNFERARWLSEGKDNWIERTCPKSWPESCEGITCISPAEKRSLSEIVSTNDPKDKHYYNNIIVQMNKSKPRAGWGNMDPQDLRTVLDHHQIQHGSESPSRMRGGGRMSDWMRWVYGRRSYYYNTKTKHYTLKKPEDVGNGLEVARRLAFTPKEINDFNRGYELAVEEDEAGVALGGGGSGAGGGDDGGRFEFDWDSWRPDEPAPEPEPDPRVASGPEPEPEPEPEAKPDWRPGPEPEPEPELVPDWGHRLDGPGPEPEPEPVPDWGHRLDGPGPEPEPEPSILGGGAKRRKRPRRKSKRRNKKCYSKKKNKSKRRKTKGYSKKINKSKRKNS